MISTSAELGEKEMNIESRICFFHIGCPDIGYKGGVVFRYCHVIIGIGICERYREAKRFLERFDRSKELNELLFSSDQLVFTVFEDYLFPVTGPQTPFTHYACSFIINRVFDYNIALYNWNFRR